MIDSGREESPSNAPFLLLRNVLETSCRADRVKTGGHAGQNVRWNVDQVCFRVLVGPVCVHQGILLDHGDRVFSRFVACVVSTTVS
jgi:hypothetical protein